MKEKKVNEIMNDIFKNENLCIIREALTQYKEEDDNENNIIIQGGSTCLISKDEVEGLNNGENAKVFVRGKEFYLEVIKGETI